MTFLFTSVWYVPVVVLLTVVVVVQNIMIISGFITARQRSSEKVMFLYVFVRQSVFLSTGQAGVPV